MIIAGLMKFVSVVPGDVVQACGARAHMLHVLMERQGAMNIHE